MFHPWIQAPIEMKKKQISLYLDPALAEELVQFGANPSAAVTHLVSVQARLSAMDAKLDRLLNASVELYKLLKQGQPKP